MDTTTVFLFDTTALRTLIARLLTLSGDKVIAANSQINTSNWQFYATVQRGASVRTGTSTGYSNEKAYVMNVSEVTYSVQVIGKNGILWAERLAAAIQLPNVRNELLAKNIGVLGTSDVRDTTVIGEAGYEERGQFDLVLSQSTIIEESASFVKTADFVLNVER